MKIDCDENEDVAIEYGIECIPTFIVFRNKEKVGEEKGAKIEKIRNFFTEHLGITSK